MFNFNQTFNALRLFSPKTVSPNSCFTEISISESGFLENGVEKIRFF